MYRSLIERITHGDGAEALIDPNTYLSKIEARRKEDQKTTIAACVGLLLLIGASYLDYRNETNAYEERRQHVVADSVAKSQRNSKALPDTANLKIVQTIDDTIR